MGNPILAEDFDFAEKRPRRLLEQDLWLIKNYEEGSVSEANFVGDKEPTGYFPPAEFEGETLVFFQAPNARKDKTFSTWKPTDSKQDESA